jgi:3-oxoadipate enol-lactonase
LSASLQITVSGNRINYEIAGDGPWLTLSHPLAYDLRVWDKQMPALTAKFQVLRYDIRGHGGSSAPTGPYTLEQLADDACDLLNTFGIERTHWVGLSLGSMIGQTFALKYPAMFQSLALAGTTSRYSARTAASFEERIRDVEANGMEAVVKSTLERWLTDSYRKTHPQVMDRIARCIRATPVAGYLGCCHAIPQINLTERLKEITCPTLVMVGAQDSGTPIAMARTIYHALPGTELVIIPSAAHLLNIEQKQTFNSALLSFLARAGEVL